MLEAALFRHDGVPGHVLHLAPHGLSVEVGQVHAVGRNHGKIAISQKENVARVIENGRNVRSDKVFVVAEADHQRRAVARGHDLVGLIDEDDSHGEDSAEFFHCLADCFFEMRVCSVTSFEEMFLDQVSDDFGIGFRRECVAFLDQLFLQAEIVLNDAVVYDDDFSGAVAMRMSILFGGTSVRGPASVSNAVAAVQWAETDRLFQIAQLAFGAANLQLVSVAGNGNSSRVIAAVLEPPQALNDDRNHGLLTDIANNATHAGTPGIQSAREQRNSSITGLVSTSRAIRSTSVCASSRLSPPSRVSSKYFPWRTSSRPLYPIFFSAPWMVFPEDRARFSWAKRKRKLSWR